ncbi:hypothetical protein WH47_01220 [Habropoda laboriosa]|uniref:Uncharacterized protein n=1 Tax=Habropoda laboriosa TaxID=597456 RepID=A0A0L7QK54_9HYME|nr:hypothetical protein WH47_01220 [Habropoda laboriosa]
METKQTDNNTAYISHRYHSTNIHTKLTATRATNTHPRTHTKHNNNSETIFAIITQI